MEQKEGEKDNDDLFNVDKIEFNEGKGRVEAIIFFVFTFMLLLVISIQMSIQTTYEVNSYTEFWIKDVRSIVDFHNLTTLDDFQSFYTDMLYNVNYNYWYGDYKKDDSDRIIVSNVRLTQRRIKLRDNTKYTIFIFTNFLI